MAKGSEWTCSKKHMYAFRNKRMMDAAKIGKQTYKFEILFSITTTEPIHWESYFKRSIFIQVNEELWTHTLGNILNCFVK